MTDDLYQHPRKITEIINPGIFTNRDALEDTDDLLTCADVFLSEDKRANMLDYFNGLCVQLEDGRYVTLELSISFEELTEEEMEFRK